MSAHLSVATMIEKSKISSDVAFVALLEIEIRDSATGGVIDTLYVANNPEPIEYMGRTYEAGAFDLSVKHRAGTLPDINLTVQDHTRTIQAYMQAHQGGVGSLVRFLFVNTGNLAQPPEIEETMDILSSSSNGDYQAVFRIGAENPLMRRFPRRRQHKDFCAWRYKGVECGYAGPLASCDFTLQGPNGCAAHANSERFGGFPGIKARST